MEELVSMICQMFLTDHLQTAPHPLEHTLQLSNGNGNGNLPPLTDSGIDFADLIQTLEKHYIEASLQMAGENESKAAKLLHLSRDTFRYRRKKLQIQDT